MDWETLVALQAILFFGSIIAFIAYNFWELHRDSKNDAPPPDDPSGQVSEAEDEPTDD